MRGSARKYFPISQAFYFYTLYMATQSIVYCTVLMKHVMNKEKCKDNLFPHLFFLRENNLLQLEWSNINSQSR